MHRLLRVVLCPSHADDSFLRELQLFLLHHCHRGAEGGELPQDTPTLGGGGGQGRKKEGVGNRERVKGMILMEEGEEEGEGGKERGGEGERGEGGREGRVGNFTSFLTLIWPMYSPSEKRHCDPRQSAGRGGREEGEVGRGEGKYRAREREREKGKVMEEEGREGGREGGENRGRERGKEGEREKEAREGGSELTIQLQGLLHLQCVSVDDSDGVFPLTQRVVVQFALSGGRTSQT